MMQTAGGGGFGDPSLRDPALVRRDVAFGYVSEPAAAKTYRNGKPVKLRVERVNGSTSSIKRRVVVAPSTATRTGLEPDALVELLSDGPSLRAWVTLDERISDDRVGLDAEALEILGASNAQAITVHVIGAARA